MFIFKASDSVKLQIQKATRERDQANANTMQIRSDFEKLLLQSNQVKSSSLISFIDLFEFDRILFNFVINLAQHKHVSMISKVNY